MAYNGCDPQTESDHPPHLWEESMSYRTSFFAPLRNALLFVVLCALGAPGIALCEEQSEIPRRPDGRPDLSGTYDTATLTPVQRPDKYGERLALTDEEAKSLAEHWAGNFQKDFEPSDPNREAPPEGGTGIYAPEFTGAAGKVGGYNAGFVDIGDSAFQLDGKWRTSIITEPRFSSQCSSRKRPAPPGLHQPKFSIQPSVMMLKPS